MDQIKFEELAFVIIKELGTHKTDEDLVKSIRENIETYHKTLGHIPRQKIPTKIVSSPI